MKKTKCLVVNRKVALIFLYNVRIEEQDNFNKCSMLSEH